MNGLCKCGSGLVYSKFCQNPACKADRLSCSKCVGNHLKHDLLLNDTVDFYKYAMEWSQVFYELPKAEMDQRAETIRCLTDLKKSINSRIEYMIEKVRLPAHDLMDLRPSQVTDQVINSHFEFKPRYKHRRAKKTIEFIAQKLDEINEYIAMEDSKCYWGKEETEDGYYEGEFYIDTEGEEEEEEEAENPAEPTGRIQETLEKLQAHSQAPNNQALFPNLPHALSQLDHSQMGTAGGMDHMFAQLKEQIDAATDRKVKEKEKEIDELASQFAQQQQKDGSAMPQISSEFKMSAFQMPQFPRDEMENPIVLQQPSQIMQQQVQQIASKQDKSYSQFSLSTMQQTLGQNISVQQFETSQAQQQDPNILSHSNTSSANSSQIHQQEEPGRGSSSFDQMSNTSKSDQSKTKPKIKLLSKKDPDPPNKQE